MKRDRYWLADAFPPPTGLYGIGKRLLPPPGQEKNELTPEISLFYPSDLSNAAPASRTRNPDIASVDAAPNAEQFPLVMYFSGWPGNAIDNYSLICELVSHGIEVATLTYPDATGGMDYSSKAAYERTVDEANRLVRLRACDAVDLLDRIEPSRAALLGFSFGGAVAAEATLMDERFCAAVNIDGRPWGRALHEGVAAPYLFLGGDRPLPTAADLNSSNPDRRYNAQLDAVDIEELTRNLRRHGGMHVTLSRAEHLDFTDGAMRWRRRRWLRLRRVDPRWVMRLTRSYVGAFLRHALGKLNADTPLPTGPESGFPGVIVANYPRPDGQLAGGEPHQEIASDGRPQ